MKYFSIILWATSLLLISGCQTKKIALADFEEITYRQGPVAANRAPANVVKIERENEAFMLRYSHHFRFVSKEDGSMKEQEELVLKKEISENQMGKLIDAINASGFLNMRQKYRDPDILDGDVKSLNLKLQGGSKEVVLVNVNKKRFNRITDVLDSLRKN